MDCGCWVLVCVEFLFGVGIMTTTPVNGWVGSGDWYVDNFEVVGMWSGRMGAGGGFYGVGDEGCGRIGRFDTKIQSVEKFLFNCFEN